MFTVSNLHDDAKNISLNKNGRLFNFRKHIFFCRSSPRKICFCCLFAFLFVFVFSPPTAMNIYSSHSFLSFCRTLCLSPFCLVCLCAENGRKSYLRQSPGPLPRGVIKHARLLCICCQDGWILIASAVYVQSAAAPQIRVTRSVCAI